MNTLQITRLTSSLGQTLREKVAHFMSVFSVPVTPDTIVRPDGVAEFYKHWPIGDPTQDDCIFASYSDNDDVIEFGLVLRRAGRAANDAGMVVLLQVSMTLEEEFALLNVMSETNSELNQDARVTPIKAALLDEALKFFRETYVGVKGDGHV